MDTGVSARLCARLHRLLLACLTCGAICVSPVSAQPAVPAPGGSDLTAQVTEVQRRLSAATARLDEVQQALQRHPDPAGAPPSTATRIAGGWQAFIDLYKTQLDFLRKIRQQGISIEAATQAAASPSPPPGSPPWPLADGDAATTALYKAQAGADETTERIRLLKEEVGRARKEREEAQARYRLGQEKSAPAGANGVAALPADDLEYIRMEVDFRDEYLYLLDLKQQSAAQELKLHELEIGRQQRLLKHYDGRYVLDADHLAQLNDRIERRRTELRDLERQAMDEMAALQRRTEAAKTPNGGSWPRGDDPSRAPEPAGRQRAILLAEQDRLQSRLDLYRYQIAILDSLKELWGVRARLHSEQKPDHAEMLKLDDALKRAEQDVARIRHELDQIVDANSQAALELREQLAQSLAPDERTLLEARLASASGKAADAREVLDRLKGMLTTMRIVAVEIDTIYRSGSLLKVLNDAWVAVGMWAGAVWDHELLAIDDTVKVEGRELRSTRSVTVGKSIGAVAILAAGYLLIHWTIHVTLALLVRRLKLREALAMQIGRWLRAIAIITLVLLSFHLVNIPFGVFAFLGGALAIGVGFGTQDLLKNLISGVMLLVERPVRIGDFVEVGGVRGRIALIGIRFSTLHLYNGANLLIPNSTLVDERLFNWTNSGRAVRGEVDVGVAYGSDAQEVRRLLIEVARAHPAVLERPGPYVLFTDFGDSALRFKLRFRVRATAEIDEIDVASDLRYAILAALDEAGVVMPFPQANVHLSADSPLDLRIKQ